MMISPRLRVIRILIGLAPGEVPVSAWSARDRTGDLEYETHLGGEVGKYTEGFSSCMSLSERLGRIADVNQCLSIVQSDGFRSHRVSLCRWGTSVYQ